MEEIVAELTVKVKVFDMLPTDAVMMEVPGVRPVTLLGLDAVTKSAIVGEALDQTA